MIKLNLNAITIQLLIHTSNQQSSHCRHVRAHGSKLNFPLRQRYSINKIRSINTAPFWQLSLIQATCFTVLPHLSVIGYATISFEFLFRVKLIFQHQLLSDKLKSVSFKNYDILIISSKKLSTELLKISRETYNEHVLLLRIYKYRNMMNNSVILFEN